jgi:hypothetical protein
VDPDKDSIVTAVSKLGGLSLDEAEQLGVAPDALTHRGHGIMRAFRKSGKSFQEMAAALQEMGYPGAAQAVDVHDLGPAVARGPLVAALQGGDEGLSRLGIAGTMRRVGFQAHDGRIFHVLTGRGGVMVAIHSEPRAADALAVLHSYGGGNAAIGAWTGRV